MSDRSWQSRAPCRGLVYGQSATSFARLYQLDFETAKATHEGYFEIRQNVASMLDTLGEMWRRYKVRSWRIPFSGRMRHWDRYDYITDPDTGEEERVDTYVSKGNVLNTLVQGSAADVFKMALRAFWRYVVLNPRYVDKVFPVMQVHDEVSVEAHESVAVEIAQLLKYCMEYPWFDLPVPIRADVHIVDNWGEGKDGMREVVDENGRVVLGEDGKPKKEVVNPEMNAEIVYLKPAVMEWCKTIIPEATGAFSPILSDYGLRTKPSTVLKVDSALSSSTSGTPLAMPKRSTLTLTSEASRSAQYVGVRTGHANFSTRGQRVSPKRTVVFVR